MDMKWLTELLNESVKGGDTDIQGLQKKIQEGYGKLFVPKDDFNKKNNDLKEYKQQVEDYKTQLGERDSQLEDLRKISNNNEDLQTKIKEMEKQNKLKIENMEKQMKDKEFKWEVNDEIRAYNPKNIKAVSALLDYSKIKKDGEHILGLKDQLDNLKENESYLFGEAKDNLPPDNRMNPANPNNLDPDTSKMSDSEYFEHIYNKK